MLRSLHLILILLVALTALVGPAAAPTADQTTLLATLPSASVPITTVDVPFVPNAGRYAGDVAFYTQGLLSLLVPITHNNITRTVIHTLITQNLDVGKVKLGLI